MFDENKIQSILLDLPFRCQVVFAASCCERLLPFYYAFSKVENWGNPTLLENALDKIWEIARAEPFSNDELTTITEFCEASIPDSEDFTSLYTSSAQNACIAVCATLEFCMSSDVPILVSVAQMSYEAVESYLQIVNDPILDAHAHDSRFDKWIETAPMLLAEIKYQQEELKLLSEAELDNTLIEKIRYKSSRSGVQPKKRRLI
jgi:uncharacterized protein YjaG (DUF416 family)